MKRNLILFVLCFILLGLKADPVMPVISDDENTTWYCIEFSHREEKDKSVEFENLLLDMGDEEAFKYGQPSIQHANYHGHLNYTQLWKIVEVEEDVYQLVAKSGRVLAAANSGDAVIAVTPGNEEKTYFSFQLLNSTNDFYGYEEDSWVLQENSNDKWFLHQNSGPTGSNVTIQKNGTPQRPNNSLRFIDPVNLGYPENGAWANPDYIDLLTEAPMPIISDQDTTVWYCIQFANAEASNDYFRRVLQDQGADAEITSIAPSPTHSLPEDGVNYAQLWKITGNTNDGYSLVAKSGRVLAVGNLNQGNHPFLKAVKKNAPDENFILFDFNPSSETRFGWAWTLLTTTYNNENRSLNLAGGPSGMNAKKPILFASIGGQNSAVNFLHPQDMGFPADGKWKQANSFDMYKPNGPSTSVESSSEKSYNLFVQNRQLVVQGDKVEKLAIYTLSGSAIYSSSNISQAFELNPGCYVVHLELQNGEHAAQKLIVQ